MAKRDLDAAVVRMRAQSDEHKVERAGGDDTLDVPRVSGGLSSSRYFFATKNTLLSNSKKAKKA